MNRVAMIKLDQDGLEGLANDDAAQILIDLIEDIQETTGADKVSITIEAFKNG